MTALHHAAKCLFPQHHKPESGGSVLPAVLLLAATAAAAYVIARYWVWLATAAAVGVGLVLVESAVRVTMLEPAARKHWAAARWHRLRWRRTAKNLRLAPIDRHRGDKIDSDRARVVNCPRARFYPDPHGFRVRLKLVDGVSRADVEATADYLAVAWRAHRIAITQPRPHRLELRALRRDPLHDPYPQAAIPPGVLPPDPAADLRKLSLYLGLDEWGEHRRIPLSGVAGITIGGQPGYGKTELVGFLLRQLSGIPAKFIIIDGKGSYDYEPWRDRAWILTDDDLTAAADAVDTAHTEMRMRLGSILELTGGTSNGWHVGPREGLELLVTIIDEASTFFDFEGVKGDRDAERTVRQIRSLTGQLVKKGRSALCLTILVSQRQQGESVPTPIRDQCAVGACFAVRNKEGAEAALGAGIRDFPSLCPTGLQAPQFIGCMTVRLPQVGADPFTRIRVPRLDPLPVPILTASPVPAAALQRISP